MVFNFDKVKLARKLNPAPIIEAIVEIRFDSIVPPGNVIDKLLLEFGKEYTTKNLPLFEIPEGLRDTDPQFRYLPVKQLIKDGLIVQIGGRVISIVNKGPYIGWPSLREKVELMIQTLKSANVVSKYLRLGVRYMNVVNSNILENINLLVTTPVKQVIDEKLDLSLGLNYKQYKANLRLSNNLHTIKNGEKVTGTLIDIDTFVEGSDEKTVLDLVDGAHDFEKRIFFALVKQDFIENNFKPEWA